MRHWQRGIKLLKKSFSSANMEDSPASSTDRKSNPAASYPAPYVVPPRSGKHENTFIVLHGRGDEGENFGRGLLRTKIPECGDLQTTFPNAKFVFPTAAKRRARVLNNATVNQWFDIKSLVNPDKHLDYQYEGLRESSANVCGLLRTVIEEVGSQNVVLWGLRYVLTLDSQGGAIMLTSLLQWDGEPFAAAIGMCTWLPLRGRMLESSSTDPAQSTSDDDPFVRRDGTLDDRERLEDAISCLREVLDGSSASHPGRAVCRQIPNFLGHGVQDEKVAVDLGRQASSFLELMGLEVQWREYEGLAHWYSGEMLRDIVNFLTGRCGFAPG